MNNVYISEHKIPVGCVIMELRLGLKYGNKSSELGEPGKYNGKWDISAQLSRHIKI